MRVLVSAYDCHPLWGSEAFTAAKWVALLAKKHQVVVCTPEYNAQPLRTFLDEQGKAVSAHASIIPIPMPQLGRVHRLFTVLPVGFFEYERRVIRVVRSRPGLLDDVGLVMHRTPISFRYPSRLWRLGVPFIPGPLGGGLQTPPELESEFAGEGLLYKLRRFDPVLTRSRKWMRYLDEAAEILVTAEYVRQSLPSRLWPKMRIVSDTGIDVGERPSRSAEGFGVLFVGRLIRQKLAHLAVRAFARFLEARPSARGVARLVIVGDGPDRGLIESEVNRCGLAGAVTLTGRLEHKEALRQYEAAHVFLYPSVIEASGNAYLEAMNAGLALVVADNGGGRYMPCDECAMKIKVGPSDRMVDGFVHALTDLYDEKNAREAMGRSGYAHVAKTYSWDVIGEQIYSVVDPYMTSKEA